MAERKRTTDAEKILKGRYVGDDIRREESVEEERVNAQVARDIHDLRREAGLTQKQLADLVGTTQSVISRLEDADYGGHSLSMLNRVARVLDKKLMVRMV